MKQKEQSMRLFFLFYLILYGRMENKSFQPVIKLMKKNALFGKKERQMTIAALVLLTGIGFVSPAFGQTKVKDTSRVVLPELKKNLNSSGSHYLKATVLAQTWVRYSELNPGSTIDGFDAGATRADIGIRRWRIQAFGQLTDRIFIYTQFGQNNFSFLQPRHAGAFLHDAVTEYNVCPQLQLGGGLTAWSGMSRFSAPAVAGILGVDAPLYQQSTIGINDQFVRKLSVYAKGELSKFQYRVALSSPLSIKNSTAAIPAINSTSNFNPEPAKMQTSGYLVWQFFEKESMTTPYLPGTYCGKKKVLNIGAGWVEQRDAMWRTDSSGDTLRTHMLLLGVDVFGELPIGKKGSAFTGYLAYNNFDFGQNYLRMNGAMNVANGVTASEATLNGAGIAYPMIGTGNILYGQFAYKFKDNLLSDNGSLQVYAASQYSLFEALDEPAITYEAGINWLIHGNGFGKISIGLQNRPVVDNNLLGLNVQTMRKNMYVLQYQISL